MTATIYTLSTGLHWYVSERYLDVTEDERKQIEAYAEMYPQQIKVEYS